MNKCHVSKKLSAYLDAQLSAKEKAGVEGHLKACSACSQELVRLKALSEQLKAWQAPEAGQGFDAAVRNKIVAWELERGEVKMKKKTWTILVPSGVLAAILMFVVVGHLHVRQGNLKGPADNMELAYNARGSGTAASVAVGGLRKQGEERYDVAKFELYDQYREGENKDFVRSKSAAVDLSKAMTTAVYDAKPMQAGEPGEGPVIIVQPSMPATGQGEKIIRTAEVTIEVEDGKAAYQKASQICGELGGYLAASNFRKDSEGREAGTITMRIPKDKFLTALEELNRLGKVESSHSDSQDVSQEYANLKSRLDASMVVYNKMLEALQKRQTTIAEAARLESEITPVLQRIEDLKNQIEALNNAVSFTTITVNFHESLVSDKVLRDSKRYIKESLLVARINAVRSFAAAIPHLFTVCIWLVVIAIIVFLVRIIRGHNT